MNRILFEPTEIKDGLVTFDDVRADHVLNVLHGEVGQTLKTGEVNGPIGTSEITAVNLNLHSQPSITVKCSHTEKSLSPWVDLILAPPRPRVMKRLLPQLATLGVGRLFLVGAQKVEKDFWGATLLKEENYRPLLVDGLMQGGASILPTLETRRSFRKFVREELDVLFPTRNRIVAHPYGVPRARKVPGARKVPSALCIVPGARKVPGALCLVPREIENASASGTKHQAPSTKHQALSTHPPLVAIGPEGGWTDEEVALLEEHGFARYSLGSRILRTDTATIALLAQLMKEFGQC